MRKCRLQSGVDYRHRTGLVGTFTLQRDSLRAGGDPKRSWPVGLHLACFAILVGCVFLPCGTFAQMTLEIALERALAQNPSLRAERRQVEAATGRMIQARLWPNPELELSSEEFPLREGGFKSATNLAGITQTLPFPGKKSLDGRIGRQEVSAAEWEYLARENDLVRDVKEAFYSTLAVEKKVEVSRQLVEIAQSLADAARKRVEAGDASDQEMLRADIELQQAIVEMSALDRELIQMRSSLAALLGQPAEPIGPLVGEFQNTPEIPEVTEARERMLAQHPIIEAMRAHRERAALELQRARLDPFPDLTVGIAGGRNYGEDRSLLEFFLSVPLPVFDRAQGRKREARALEEIGHLDLSATEQRLIRDLDDAIARLQAAGEQVRAYRDDILPKAEDAFGLVRGGFEAGKFGYLELVDTQRMSASVRLAYYGKLSELSSAQADLDALIGEEALRRQLNNETK